MINTDIAIIGAGPVGLFAVFEGRTSGAVMFMDALPQLADSFLKIYPHKPIL